MSSALAFVTINVVNNTPWDLATNFNELDQAEWVSAPKGIPKGETGQITAGPTTNAPEFHGHVDYEVQDNDRSRLTVLFTFVMKGLSSLQLIEPKLYTSTSSYMPTDFPFVATATFSKA